MILRNTKIVFNEYTLYFLLIAILSGYIKMALMILFIVLFHELGHIIIASIFHYDVKKVEIYPFGGMCDINKMINVPIYKDILIASGGILFQILLFFIFNNEEFIYYNKNILLFNLLPIIPLDGSKIFFYIINIFFSYQKSLKIYPLFSFVFIILYLLINYHYNLNNYLIISLFVLKTIEFIRYKKIYYQKFLIERGLYNIKYKKISQGLETNNFKRESDYYDIVDGKVITQKEYIAWKMGL